MSDKPTIVFCQCAHFDVIDPAVRKELFARLTAAGVDFEIVDDLCGLAARRDRRLVALANARPLRVVACRPRTVKWLFHAAGVPLDDIHLEVFDMREQSAEDIAQALSASGGADSAAAPPPADPPDWVPWFPVIDYDRCRNCKQCLNFCLFGVYATDEDGRVVVAHPDRCKTHCPACARVCPAGAIIFPKYASGPISGLVPDESSPARAVRVDVNQLIAGDVRAALRSRGRSASTVSAEDLEIPPEALAALRRRCTTCRPAVDSTRPDCGDNVPCCGNDDPTGPCCESEDEPR